MEISGAQRADLPEILALQKLAFYQQACLAGSFRIRPMLTNLEELEMLWEAHRYVKGVREGRIVAAARGCLDGPTCRVGNVIVRPDHQGKGLGKAILAAVEAAHPEAGRFELFTAAASVSNVAFYEKAGYRTFRVQPAGGSEPELVFMEKLR